MMEATPCCSTWGPSSNCETSARWAAEGAKIAEGRLPDFRGGTGDPQ